MMTVFEIPHDTIRRTCSEFYRGEKDNMNLNLGKNPCPKLNQEKQKLKTFYFQKRIDFSDQG